MNPTDVRQDRSVVLFSQSVDNGFEASETVAILCLEQIAPIAKIMEKTHHDKAPYPRASSKVSNGHNFTKRTNLNKPCHGVTSKFKP